MKSIYLSFALAAFGFFACDKEPETNNDNNNNSGTSRDGDTEEVPELGKVNYDFTHKSLLLEFTSTGCPGCGSWGKPTFYSLVNEFKDDMVPIAAHIKYGDPMISGVSEFLAGNRTGSRYTPQIWVNNQSIMVLSNNSINGAASVQNARDLINGDKGSVGIGLGSVSQFKNDKMYTKYGVSLKAEVPAGEYYVASYLMEDGLKYQQAGVSSANNPVTHNYVVRQAANGAWGNMITKEVGKELVAEWEHTYDKDVNAKQYLVNVIWKKEGSTYVPMNIGK